ncbi:MAG: S8 family serine peptidase [Acidobacteriota bacterium]
MPIDRNTPRIFTTWFAALVLIALSLPVFAAPSDRAFDRRNVKRDQFLLTTSDIERSTARYGLEIIAKRGGPASNTYLVRAPRGVNLTTVVDTDFSGVEQAALASLPTLDLAAIDVAAEASEDIQRSGTFSTPCIDTFLGETWSGFVDQRALRKVRVHATQYLSGWYCGQGVVVAVIDTGIDTSHPLFANALVGGHDFLAAQETETEFSQQADLDVRIRTIVESSHTSTLNGSANMVVLDTAAVLLGDVDASVITDLETYPSHYGHGDMVAGIVRAVAPGAKIMPLRVFDVALYVI